MHVKADRIWNSVSLRSSVTRAHLDLKNYVKLSQFSISKMFKGAPVGDLILSTVTKSRRRRMTMTMECQLKARNRYLSIPPQSPAATEHPRFPAMIPQTLMTLLPTSVEFCEMLESIFHNNLVLL